MYDSGAIVKIAEISVRVFFRLLSTAHLLQYQIQSLLFLESEAIALVQAAMATFLSSPATLQR